MFLKEKIRYIQFRQKRAVNGLNSSKLALFMLVVVAASGLTMPIIMDAVKAIADEADQNIVLMDS